jgi:hypothetical protein
MKKTLLKTMIFMAFVGLFFTSCVSNYRVQFIRTARAFALENQAGLTDKDIHIIKFTVPIMKENTLYSRDGSNKNKNDIVQTVAIWELPDQEGKSLMVVGFGERRLNNWNPNRVILKHFRSIPQKRTERQKEKSQNK